MQFGGVAQLGEHLLCKQGVIGSIPFTSTIPFFGQASFRMMACLSDLWSAVVL